MGLSNYLPSSRIAQPGVCTSSTRPASPYEGQVIYETDTDRVLVWNASAWVAPNSTTANPPGLELVKTQTVGTAVSSVTVSDAFSATYDAYKIIWTNGTQSVDTNLTMSIGSATSNYYLVMIYGPWNSTAVLNAGNNNSTLFSWAGGNGNASIEVINPFLTKPTEMQARIRYSTVYGNSVALLTDTNSHSSFTLTPASGTMTGGTIRVYGYRN